MMEYIFFDETLCARFIEFARRLDVPCQQKQDAMGITVAVPEDLDDSVADSLETHYDQLLEEQADLTGETEPGQKHAADLHRACRRAPLYHPHRTGHNGATDGLPEH